VEHFWSDPKIAIFRNEELRRVVALVPCAACGAIGRTQCAHIGGLKQGKGAKLKVPDSHVASLCTVTLGFLGCHEKFDQYLWLTVDGVSYDTSDPMVRERLCWMLIAKTYIMVVEAGLLKVHR